MARYVAYLFVNVIAVCLGVAGGATGNVWLSAAGGFIAGVSAAAAAYRYL